MLAGDNVIHEFDYFYCSLLYSVWKVVLKDLTHLCIHRDGRIKLYGSDYSQAILESNVAVPSKFLKVCVS